MKIPRFPLLWRHHGTKLVGLAQVTAGVLATSSVLPQKGAGWCALVGGLITAWRGYSNTKSEEPTSPDKD